MTQQKDRIAAAFFSLTAAILFSIILSLAYLPQDAGEVMAEENGEVVNPDDAEENAVDADEGTQNEEYEGFLTYADHEVDSAVSEVEFGNEENEGILSGYAENIAHTDVQLSVTPLDASGVDEDIKTKANELFLQKYNGIPQESVGFLWLDMSVMWREGAAWTRQASADAGDVMEIQITCDLTAKYDPLIIREHGGEVTMFEKLSARPASAAYRDGTYFTDGEKKIWLYTQKFLY